MANILTKAIPMTLITPIKPRRTFFKRILFWAVGGPLKSMLGTLKKLTFIHFARWVIIAKKDWPYLGDGQPREEPHYDYMLFCSNYNGAWDQYIDAFSNILARGLNLLWKWSIGWQDANQVTPLKRYIRKVEFEPTDYYFSAYPSASTSDVKSALAASAALQALGAGYAHMTPIEFQEAYREMLRRNLKNLGTLGPSPVRTVNEWAPRPGQLQA